MVLYGTARARACDGLLWLWPCGPLRLAFYNRRRFLLAGGAAVLHDRAARAVENSVLFISGTP
jgi:hypothetical protein